MLDARKGRGHRAGGRRGASAGRLGRASSRSSVWQTGSGTQTNMNVNEVMANRASELLGGERGAETPRPPQRRRQPRPVVERRLPDRDARGRGRAPSAALLPALAAPARHAGGESRGLRGHREDRPHAPPGRDAAHARPGDLRLGRRSSTTASPALEAGAARTCCELALGGTAVGTGLNTHPEFADRVGAPSSRELTGQPFVTAPNKFEALAAHDALVFAHGALKTRRGLADQDRQRRALARLGPALRPRRDPHPRERAGQLDHAGQGEPDPVRGADHGARPR